MTERKHTFGFNRKHTKPQVMDILSDCVDGLLEYSRHEKITVSGTTTTKKTEFSGYSCVQRALLANGVYESKLRDWGITWRHDEEITHAIACVREIGRNVIHANTVEELYSARVGTFLMGAVLGMYEKSREMELNAHENLIRILAVGTDGTKEQK